MCLLPATGTVAGRKHIENYIKTIKVKLNLLKIKFVILLGHALC